MPIRHEIGAFSALFRATVSRPRGWVDTGGGRRNVVPEQGEAHSALGAFSLAAPLLDGHSVRFRKRECLAAAESSRSNAGGRAGHIQGEDRSRASTQTR